MIKSGSQNENVKNVSSHNSLNHTKMTNDFVKVVTVWSAFLLAMNTVYLAFAFFKIDQNNLQYKRISCITIGVLLHFFLIASFSLSSVITIVQYIFLNRVFYIIHNLLAKSIVFSLGK